MQLLRDPLLYMNWGIAFLSICAASRMVKSMKKDIETADHARYLWKFFGLVFVMGLALYATQKLGDMSLIKLGIQP